MPFGFFGKKKTNEDVPPGRPTGGAPPAPRKGAPTNISRLRELLSTYDSFTFSDFDLYATVGTGTFGRVRMVKLNGHDDRTPMALKILKKCEVIKLKQVEHIKAEKAILQQISHPFVVNMLATFHDEKRLFLLLEFQNGGELFSHLRNSGRLSNDDSRFYAAQVSLVFVYLHSLDIVYRDLKPENLLLSFEGNIKVVDFGFAKHIPLGKTYTLCGTPEYLCPECITSKGHGKGADWWATGILTFEMLAGYPPFFDEQAFGIYQKILAGKIDWPKHFDVRVKDMIKRLLTPDAAKRLGCLKAGGEEVIKHKWYKGLDMQAMHNGHIAVPYVPTVSSADDTSMFDKYPESTEASAAKISSKDAKLFADF